ncbi:hypothetical protein [Dickeya undicola]|uniref:hypothetical protein n=1 Tax=Dickeya undicola TaxID=1577887 RepID=UPI0013752520|nr:hypothetical protein [Dickeya undicola]
MREPQRPDIRASLRQSRFNCALRLSKPLSPPQRLGYYGALSIEGRLSGHLHR